MKFFKPGKISGFTMIELMVSIFVTLAAIGTFYKLYTNSIKSHRNSNVRISVNLLGEHMIGTIADSIRLAGLSDEYIDYDPGAGVSGNIITSSDGSDGTDSVDFRFLSPYGGPITKIMSVSGGAGACTFDVINSSSLHADLGTVNLFSSNGLFTGTVGSVTNNKIITSSFSPAFAGNCDVLFPAGTLLTGPNNNFILTYINGGTNTSLTLVRDLGGGASEIFVDFNSNDNPDYQIPFLVFEFMTEHDSSGTIIRDWVESISDAEELKEVKAVRIGFVIVSQQERVKKKVSTSDPGVTINYCPFDNRCYPLTDLNKSAYVFRRVIHLRNYDYMGRQ